MSQEEKAEASAGRPIKRLKRSRRDRVIAGVCGGVADYIGIDPIIVRVLWLAAMFWGGSGLLAYIIAMVIIPPAREGETEPSSGAGGRLALGVLLVLIGLFFILMRHYPVMFLWRPEPRLWLPIGLVLTGLVILIVSRRQNVPGMGEHSPADYKGGRVDQQEQPPESDATAFDRPQGERLWRSSRERVILGICGGIGVRYRVDPVLVRLIWIFVTLVTHGAGVIIYLLLYFLIPLEPVRAVKTGGDTGRA